jgi:hypothetical protein
MSTGTAATVTHDAATTLGQPRPRPRGLLAVPPHAPGRDGRVSTVALGAPGALPRPTVANAPPSALLAALVAPMAPGNDARPPLAPAPTPTSAPRALAPSPQGAPRVEWNLD